MTDELLPEFDWCIEERLHFRCTACGGWWTLSDAQRDRHYFCPHCQRETAVYLVTCDGHPFETHRCPDHGDVVPMRSGIANHVDERPA